MTIQLRLRTLRQPRHDRIVVTPICDEWEIPIPKGMTLSELKQFALTIRFDTDGLKIQEGWDEKHAK